MRLDDMMQVLRDEFELAAADVDNALVAWMGDEPANAPTHCEAVIGTFDRLASVSRMVGLEGQAVVIEQLRDAAMLAAMSDESAMAAGLGWLALWREPLAASYGAPGDADCAMALVEYLAAGPVPPSLVAVSKLHELLLRGPVLPVEDEEARAASFLMPLDDDVSIAVPEDVDAGLYETFLADAPDQLARLGDTVRALAREPVDVAVLVEAQRVAHTFKGSGNIIGIRGIGRLAHRIEDLLDFAIAQEGRLPAPMARDLESATATLDQMIYALRGEEAEPADALRQLGSLVRWAAAIDDGSWAALVAEPAAALAAAVPAAARPSPAASAPGSEAAPDAEAQVRVAASRLGWMVRQAGQSLVQQGRLADRSARLEERLSALIASQQSLEARLRDLQAQIDRQGVNLQEKAEQDSASFDPLEMDRYSELHTLARFVAEMAADGQDLAQSAQEEARGTAAALTEHQRVLKAQHAELLRARLVPFRNIVARLRRNVSQTAATTGKQVQLVVEGEQIQLDGDVLERLTEALLHLLRNAVDHGIESPDDRRLMGKPAEGTVHLKLSRDGQTIRIVCRDDGRGLDLPAIHAKALALGLLDGADEPDAEALARTILLPGFSTRDAVNDVSGRGVGMDVVAERVRGMKGQLEIATEALAGTSFTLRVPATTGAAHALVVEVAGERFALPAEAVVVGVPAAQALREGDRLVFGESSWRCVSLATAVGLADTADPLASRPAVVLRVGREEIALLIDRVIEARELILQDVGRLLRRVRGISSGALRVDGRVMFMLDPDALDGAQRAVDEHTALALRRRMQAERQRALVVDDSHSVRKTLAQLLGDAGYEVRTARDGFDALDQLSRQHADIVLTDLEMPNLNGLDLTRRLRESAAWKSLPVIMITSRGTDKHRAGATQAGVSAYLTKPYTDGELLGQVRGLLAA